MHVKKIMNKVIIFITILGITINILSGTTLAMTVVLPNVIENYDFSSSEVSFDMLEFEHIWSGNMSDHIVKDENSISFYGYDSLPFFDALFTDRYQLDTLEFDIPLSEIDFYGMLGTGFWVNASISDDNKITGYMVALGSAELPDIRFDALETKISLFYVEDLDIGVYNKTIQSDMDGKIGSDIDNEDLDLGTNNETVQDNMDGNDGFEPDDKESDIGENNETIQSGMDNENFEPVENNEIALDSDLFLPGVYTLLEAYNWADIAIENELSDVHFKTEFSSSSFQVYLTFDGQSETMLFEREVSSGTERGFGLYTQHGNQSYNQAMSMRYSNVLINSATGEGTTAQVNFKLSGTEEFVAESQIKNGLAGELYKITPPDIDGYQYMSASREAFDILVYDENPDNNITDLFYVAESAPVYLVRSLDKDFMPSPSDGPNINQLFHLVDETEEQPIEINSYLDETYQNVAVITPHASNQFGAMWAKEKLDLNIPFNIKMQIFLGHNESEDGQVADGMTFTLQNDYAGLNAIGGRGGGLGAYTGRADDVTDGEYLKNSLCIEFDTFRNNDNEIEDPVDTSPNKLPAHCALVIPEGPIKAEPSDEYDIWSCHVNTFFFQPSQEWIEFQVEWKPKQNDWGYLGGVLIYTFAGQEKKIEIFNVDFIFGGSKVYWGFTGSTGKLSALQAVAIIDLPGQKSSKKVSELSEAGVAGASIKVGDEITYEISYINSSGRKANLTITDMLPDGLEYVQAKDENNNLITEYPEDDRNIVWKIPNIDYGKGGMVTIIARVTEKANTIVLNKAHLEWRFNDSILKEDVEAENLVVSRKTVMINYVDREGVPLIEPTTDWVNINTEYTYTVPVLDGYEINGWKLDNIEQENEPITTFEVEANTEITLIYAKKNMANFSFYKVNVTNPSEILPGAEFKLYIWDSTGDVPNELVPKSVDGSGWKLIDTQTSGGQVLFDNLSPGVYQLVETKAPTGYQLPQGQWRFEINGKGEINILPCVGEYKIPSIKENDAGEIPYLIGNVKQYKLPETGGGGILRFSIMGILLLATGVLSAVKYAAQESF